MRIIHISRLFLLSIVALVIGLSAGISFAEDDFIYNPPQQFVNDFFSALSGTGTDLSAQTNATVIMRRLYSIREKTDNNDMLSAWQALISLPEIENLPEINDASRDAHAIQSAIPWYSDKELKNNFISAYEDIWLKNNKMEKLDTFKSVFGGYASRRLSANPAVFIRDNLGYYGYTKGASQPADDLVFIQNLFINFSRLADMSAELGSDYHSLDLNELSNSLLGKTARRIDDAWHQALALENARSGKTGYTETESSQPESKTNPAAESSITPKLDVSKLNVFRFPDDPGPLVDEAPALPVVTNDDVPPPFASGNDEEENLDEGISPLLNGEGLEPPEPVEVTPESKPITIPNPEKSEPKVQIPSSDEQGAPAEIIDIGKSIPPENNTEIEKTENTPESPKETEPQKNEEPVKSVFAEPANAVVQTETKKPAESPTEVKTEPKPVEEPVKTEKIAEETKPSTEIDLLKTQPDTSSPQKPPETPKVETKPEEPKPVETKPIEPQNPEVKPVENKTAPIPTSEAAKIATDLTNKTIGIGEELGKLAIDLVILWSNGPEGVKDYDTQEADLENKFRIKKEEFLALLYLSDAFKLEEDLGLTFDTFNGKVISALMKGYDDFRKSDGFEDNPGITEEELLQAVSQLTEGVQARRDSIKIQNASLRAFKQRKSQFADTIAKLEKIKKIKLAE